MTRLSSPCKSLETSWASSVCYLPMRAWKLFWLNICSFILPPAIRYSSCSAAPGASATHTKPVHCELECRCRRLAMGKHVYPREAAWSLLQRCREGRESCCHALPESDYHWVPTTVYSTYQGCWIPHHAHRSVFGGCVRPATVNGQCREICTDSLTAAPVLCITI